MNKNYTVQEPFFERMNTIHNYKNLMNTSLK